MAWTKAGKLFEALEELHCGKVKILLRDGINPKHIYKKRSHGYTLLHDLACAQESVFKFEILRNIRILKRRNILPFNGKFLRYIESQKHIAGEIINILPELRSNVDLKSNDGFTPLMFAAECGCDKIVKSLLLAGADVNVKNIFGKTPLHYAVHNRHLGNISLLLNHGAGKNIPDNNGITPWQLAIVTGATNTLLSLLIENGENISERIKKLQNSVFAYFQKKEDIQEFSDLQINISDPKTSFVMLLAYTALRAEKEVGCGGAPFSRPDKKYIHAAFEKVVAKHVMPLKKLLSNELA